MAATQANIGLPTINDVGMTFIDVKRGYKNIGATSSSITFDSVGTWGRSWFHFPWWHVRVSVETPLNVPTPYANDVRNYISVHEIVAEQEHVSIWVSPKWYFITLVDPHPWTKIYNK